MRQTMRGIAALSVLMGVVGACADSPLQPATTEAVQNVSVLQPGAASAGEKVVERWVESYVSDMDGVYLQMECEDGTVSEMIAMEGRIHVTSTILRDGSGMFHYKAHTRSTGLRGTGMESGEEYRGVERSRESSLSGGDASKGTYRYETTLRGTESGRRLSLITQGSYAFAADGSLVRENERIRARCEL